MASPDAIMQRLEALRLWQEAEQQKLIEQQIAQRNSLISEQQRMYEALGLSFENSSVQNSKTDCDSSEYSKSFDESIERSSVEGVSVLEGSDDSESSDTDTDSKREDCRSVIENKSQIDQLPDEVRENNQPLRPKKPFLKRGTGLVKYRMNLQDCKLSNLPKYKFSKSNASKKLKLTSTLNVKTKTKDPKILPAESTLKKPDIKLNSKKIPATKNLKLDSNTDNKPTIELKNINKTDNVNINCNLLPSVDSAPLKFNSNAKRKQNVEPKSRNYNTPDNLILHLANEQTKKSQTWASALEKENIVEQNLNDSVLNSTSNTQQDILDLKVFELLEQKANNSSFCSNSSLITKFLNNEQNLKIRPDPSEINLREDFTDSESNDTKSTRNSESEHKFRVRFADNVQMQSDSDTSQTDLESCSDISSLTSSCTSTPNIKFKFGESKSHENTTYENNTQDNTVNENTAYGNTTNDNTTYENTAYENTTYGNTTNDNTTYENTSNDNTTYENTTYENTSNEITINQNSTQENSTLKNIIDQSDKDRLITNLDTKTSNRQSSSTKDILAEQINVADLEGKKQIIEQSTLLKKRLLELEKEIQVFRKENTALTQCKQEYELQKIAFQRQKRQTEIKLTNEKQEYDNYLAEQKRKLAEDRLVFEKYVNDLKKHPTKKEREEIISLKEKINELQQELRSKDAKYGASNARLRTHIRNLETDLQNRQKSIDELKEKNKKLLLANNQYRKTANKKMLQEIQCNLSKVTNDTEVQKPSAKVELNKESAYFNSPNSNNVRDQNEYFSESNSEDEERVEINNKSIIVMVDKETMTESIMKPVENTGDFANFKKMLIAKDKQIESLQKSISHEPNSFSANGDQTNNAFFVDSISTRNDHNLQNNFSSQFTNFEPMSFATNSFQKQREEILHPDGRKEIWYSNGNVKKISPDEQTVKMIYYNGDIKEIFKSTNTVKYFYAKNKMWHSTFADGMEILEFPNGQTEIRYKNGTSEIRFPDGSVRVTKSLESNILDEWRYPDGSILVNKKNGEKMLCMPNGQREIHTAEHRRREFPDGTVKLVYPDGSQETRYANGRIRTKDAFGNLIKDTHAL